MSVRGFVSGLLLHRYVRMKQIIDTAASSCVDLDLVDLQSIEEGFPIEICMSLLRRLNGERDVRGKVLSRPTYTAKQAAALYPWCNKELNIIKTRKTWDARFLLIELELFWFENALDIFELMEQLRVRKQPSTDAIRYLLAVSMHPIPYQIVDHLQRYMLLKYKHNQLFFQLHDLVYEFEETLEKIQALPNRVTSTQLDGAGIHSERLDILAIADEKRWWSKATFIRTIRVRLHEQCL